MATELYDLTVPVFIRNLENLSKILAKGEAFATEKGIDPAELTGARLIADMGPLTAQIQRASDSAKGLPVRFGVENIAMADDEVTFADMQARIAKTIDFLKTVPARSDRWQGGHLGHACDTESQLRFYRRGFRATLRTAQFLFSHDNRLRPAPHEGRADR